MFGTLRAARYFAVAAVLGRSELAKEKRDLVAFDQRPNLLYRLGRTICVVQCDIVDLPSSDTTPFIKVGYVAKKPLTCCSHARNGAAEGKRAATLISVAVTPWRFSANASDAHRIDEIATSPALRNI